MMDIIFASMVEELQKIAVEASTEGTEDTTADVEQEEISPAAKDIFNATKQTRITQPKDEKGRPAMLAHGSPVVSSEEGFQKAINVGKKEGYSAAAKQGVEQAARVGKKAYEDGQSAGYSAAAKQGVEIASRLYLKGRAEGSTV